MFRRAFLKALGIAPVAAVIPVGAEAATWDVASRPSAIDDAGRALLAAGVQRRKEFTVVVFNTPEGGHAVYDIANDKMIPSDKDGNILT